MPPSTRVTRYAPSFVAACRARAVGEYWLAKLGTPDKAGGIVAAAVVSLCPDQERVVENGFGPRNRPPDIG
jgi:hypothetical protein